MKASSYRKHLVYNKKKYYKLKIRVYAYIHNDRNLCSTVCNDKNSAFCFDWLINIPISSSRACLEISTKTTTKKLDNLARDCKYFDFSIQNKIENTDNGGSTTLNQPRKILFTWHSFFSWLHTLPVFWSLLGYFRAALNHMTRCKFDGTYEIIKYRRSDGFYRTICFNTHHFRKFLFNTWHSIFYLNF